MQPYLARVKDHITGENFAVLNCANCGLGVTENPPEDLAPYYRDYYGGRHGFTAEFRANRRLALVEAKFKAQTERSLLDVGCGEGTFLMAARKHGWTVAGTEMNPTPAQKEGLEVVTDLQSFAGKREFDCVTLWHSLEHMPDPEKILRTIHPLLKTKGWLFVAVPDAGGWQAQLSGKDWLHLDVPRHLFHFGRQSLRQLLEKCGFQVRDQHHQEFEYDVLGWSQSALNKIFATRNLFFLQLTGKAPEALPWERAGNLLIGPVLSAAAVPATWFSALCKRGGTLIFATQKA